MKLHRRYIYIVIAVFSAAGFLWAAEGHIYRLRMESIKYCNQLGLLFCSPGHKVMVDIMEEHRNLVLDAFIVVFGLSLILFVLAWFSEIKKNNYIEDETEDIEKPKKSKKLAKN